MLKLTDEMLIDDDYSSYSDQDKSFENFLSNVHSSP